MSVKSTEGRVFWFAIFESLLTVGIAFAQVFIIKTFFSRSGIKPRV
jgi:hypothetical protein